MGEIIRKLGEIQIGKMCFDVEINKATQKKNVFDIHIQNESFRLCISERDFCRMAAAVICGNAKMQKYKEGDYE
ncbi:MAG: hypothetical protein NC305_08490 [Lachnospiraceae bacterium]|nr:hypothetical protein [Butyrivibrio sp.]MCM1343401.1 hypothetical protein [Muribaculaceae bacterium]MCM1410570.1 hypothetical protein [Lachnospiraceae bacterium]